MHTTRLLTALALGTPVVACVLWAPAAWLAALFAVFVVGGGWEWSRLAGWPRIVGGAYALALGVVLALLYLLPMPPAALAWIMALVAFWWLFVAASLVGLQDRLGSVRPGALGYGFVGGLVLVPAWLALVSLAQGLTHGRHWVLVLMVLIWVADSAAYFGGRRYGRRRLAARISPGKTWEGLAAALLAVACASTALAWWAPALGPGFVALCLVTALISVAGDLFESLVKRWAGVKDSGALLPGHGGVLDRIDSLTAAAPIFVGGMMWLGID